MALRYVGDVRELGVPDLAILPGTKSTLADLAWLRQVGLGAGLRRRQLLSGSGLTDARDPAEREGAREHGAESEKFTACILAHIDCLCRSAAFCVLGA